MENFLIITSALQVEVVSKGSYLHKWKRSSSVAKLRVAVVNLDVVYIRCFLSFEISACSQHNSHNRAMRVATENTRMWVFQGQKQ
jgi:hypothetical protein